MDKILLSIDPSLETTKITSFIRSVLEKQGFENVVIGMSGGIDSATSFFLLSKVLKPEQIFAAHLYYFKSHLHLIKEMLKDANIPQKNSYNISIKQAVDSFADILGLDKNAKDYNMRLGNIMARVRMVILYDLAKKHTALVCGTENKSELHLGYFTRFGDEASDFEPIQHLYKTQVYQLARYLKIPQHLIDQDPTAGLWEGQTDEGDFGFSYKEADAVFFLHFEKKLSIKEIIAKGFPNAQKIIKRTKTYSYKHHLPYAITDRSKQAIAY